MTTTSSDKELNIDIKELKQSKDKNSKLFSELLDTISTTEDKKKALWKEIYENSTTDRQNAYLCYIDVYNKMVTDKDYVMLGPIAKKFLESMAKSTDQLTKLAEIITEAQRAAEEIDSEDMFDEIIRSS